MASQYFTSGLDLLKMTKLAGEILWSHFYGLYKISTDSDEAY